MGPFFGRGEGAVHEALIPGNLAALVQLRQEGAPQLQQDALLLPLPESPPAGGGAPVLAGQFAPGSPGPQNALEAPAIVRPGAAPLRIGFAGREMGLDQLPLPIGEAAPCHSYNPPGGGPKHSQSDGGYEMTSKHCTHGSS